MRGQNLLLLVASYAFYGWWDIRFCLLMLVSSVVDFFVGRWMPGVGAARRRVLLATSLAANLGLLGYFKYLGFFVESAASLLQSFGVNASVPSLEIILPVGISFYTFQTLSYTIDIYRGKLMPSRDFLAYMAFVAFFPQLVAGPIERASNLVPQFERRRGFDYEQAVDGARMILWGLFKKMVLADSLAVIVDGIYGSPSAGTGPEFVLATGCFAFQIYLDFSAYSDIAIGTAKMLGIDLMRNFAYPYFSQSVAEFWRRWHISLSTWFRDYVFIPLGGSRRGRGRTAVAVLMTFVASGLWHGASWNFVVWGALNGLAILPVILSRMSLVKVGPSHVPGGTGKLPSLSAAGRMASTFAFICLTWVFFRAPDLEAAILILLRMIRDAARVECYSPAIVTLWDNVLPVSLVIGTMVVEWFTRQQSHPLRLLALPRAARWATYATLFWLIAILGTRNEGAFIYFQF